MFNVENFFFGNSDFFNFKDQEISRNYHDYSKHNRQEQITAVTALTAILYILYYQFNKLILPADLSGYLMIIQLCVMPLILFSISYLSSKQIAYNFMTFLFMLVPIVAVVGNMIITSQMQSPQPHFTEIYLIVFWTLTVSGLRFLHATFSALGVLIISSLSIFYFFPESKELWILHLFWLFTSFSFAFFGGYMLEKRNKDAFLAYEELIAIASTDSLTGFQNKNILNELIEIEMSRFKRYKHPFSIVLVSIDDFNETKTIHGHQISDLALIEIVKLIKEHVRLTDVVVRLEDEKFVIIYQETDAETLKILVEKLRRTIEAYIFKSIGQQTISAGLTAHKEHDDSESIMQRLIEALHKAKAKGKNHIVFL